MVLDDTRTYTLLAAMTITAFVLRAHMLDSPRTPVYDESYMGVIVNKYIHGNEFFFDIHPPFTRLVYYYCLLYTSDAADD